MIVLLAVLSAAATAAQSTPPASEAVPPPVYYNPPTLEPAKAQLARSVAAKLLPAGITAELLGQPFNAKVEGLAHSFLMLPVERFAQENRLKLPQEGMNGPPTVRLRLLQILDPVSQSRDAVINPIIRRMAAEAAATKEPQLREALALAYGQRLNVSELQALDRFLATPEGTAFARTSVIVETDLSVFAARQFIDRAIVDAISAMMSSLTAATASLPRTKNAADLTESERRQIAELLQVDPSQPK